LEQRLNWLIVGAGAIGTYIGGSLILHGQKVVFLEQPEAVPEIQAHGLKLNIHGQEHHILQPDVYASLPYILSQTPFDLAIFALKSYDTQNALELIRSNSTNFPPVLCLQNGVENEPALESVLGKDRVISATLTSAVRRRGVGDIFLERQRGIGVAEGHPLSARAVAVLSEAGLNAQLYSSAPAMKWSKLVTNLLANASSAILEMTPADILSHTGLYLIEINQLREAFAVMHGLQIKPVDLPGTPVRAFAWIVKNLSPQVSRLIISRIAGKGRGQKMPSFFIDLRSGRGKSEVDYLNGAVVRFGASLKIPTAVNNWLNQTLLSLTQGRLPLNEFSHQPDKFLLTLHSFLATQPE
jgi:2-dehydropantoate 2-reductase